MNFIVERLIRTVDEIFTDGKGLEEPMKNAVQAAYMDGNIHFSLQSQFGSLFNTAPEMTDSVSPAWKQSAFQTLIPDSGFTARFVFSVSSKVWEILSCFAVNTMMFYTAITLKEADSAAPCLRAGIMKLMSSMCSRCRTVLLDYMQPLLQPGAASAVSDAMSREKLVIRRISEFSGDVRCVALIDHDGFILNTGGTSEEIEKVASNLSLFHERCVRELGFMGSINLRSEMFSCSGMTMLIGHIKRTNLTLALSARGDHAKSFAVFLFELAQTAFGEIARETGALWGAPLDKKTDFTRVRTSWFGPVQLVAQGKYVGKKGGKAFHLCSCKSLLKSEDDSLEWFDKRADAIRSGLSPCRSCNP